MTTHKVKKAVLELHGDEETLLVEAQKQLSQGLQSYLKQIIEKICSKYSSTDQLHLLDKVEIDLGVLETGKGLSVLMQKFEKTFEVVLRKEIDQVKLEDNNDWNKKDNQLIREDKLKSAIPNDANRNIELLRYYVRSGMLPWWAENEGIDSLQTIFKQLLIEERERVNYLLQSILDQPIYTYRLIQLIPDTDLQSIPGIHSSWVDQFTHLKQHLPYDQEYFRTQYWSTLLLHPLTSASEPTTPILDSFLKSVKTLWPETSNWLKDQSAHPFEALLVLEIWKGIDTSLKNLSLRDYPNAEKHLGNLHELIWQHSSIVNKDRLFIQTLEQLKKELEALQTKSFDNQKSDFIAERIESQIGLNLYADFLFKGISSRNKRIKTKFIDWLSANEHSDSILFVYNLKETLMGTSFIKGWEVLQANQYIIDQVDLFKLVKEKRAKKRTNKTDKLLENKIQSIIKNREEWLMSYNEYLHHFFFCWK